MTEWFSKRWVWAALAGATVTAGMAAGRADGDGPPKVGAVVSLNIDGKGERQFKVLKSEKQPDGTYLSELKDTKNGETITLVDKPGDAPPAGKTAEPAKPPEPPKAKPRTSDPLVPPVAATLPDASKDKEKEKRPILGRVFGDKDKPAPTPVPAAAAATPKAEPPADPGKRPGLITRIFGPKKPAAPTMPASAGTPPAGAVMRPGTSVAPPPVLPVPPGGLGGAKPPAASGAAPQPFPGAATGAEPPRVMPAKPVAPPTPAVAAPLPVPAPAPAFPAPKAAPIPALPVPSVPSIPVPPGGSGLPPIPVPPGGTSSATPIQVVVPAGYVPAGVAFDREVQPFVIALQSMTAPSARLTAAKGLAEGRHCSTDGVKSVLFQAAQMDPCGEVRAACIDHLCKLGYFSPQFLGHIQAACEDTDPQVRDAAKAACAKMLRK